jgi:hypothetical protein
LAAKSAGHPARASPRGPSAHPPDPAGCIKHGGFRMLARNQSERVQIWSRGGADFA